MFLNDMDKRKFNGGNKNAGRKPKADEQKLIERLGKYEVEAHQILEKCVKEEKRWAVQMYFNYMYGKPKETKDITLNSEQPLFEF